MWFASHSKPHLVIHSQEVVGAQRLVPAGAQGNLNRMIILHLGLDYTGPFDFMTFEIRVLCYSCAYRPSIMDPSPFG